jgi:predicted amidohydrolase
VKGTLRVAAWQCEPRPLDVPGNLRRLDEACVAAAARQAQVLVTPEMFTSGYAITRAGAERLAQDAELVEAAVAEIAKQRQIAIAYGHPEPAADHGTGGRAYNSATLMGPDGIVRGRHRKVHLYGDLDRDQFAPGPARPAAFDFDGSRAGLLICYDVEFPEAARSLAVDGARAILVPTANMVGCEQVQDILVRARACENGCGVVYANYCGADDVFEYNGLSLICGPRGEVLAQAGARGEELLVADLPLEPAGTYLADRRPGLYGG